MPQLLRRRRRRRGASGECLWMPEATWVPLGCSQVPHTFLVCVRPVRSDLCVHRKSVPLREYCLCLFEEYGSGRLGLCRHVPRKATHKAYLAKVAMLGSCSSGHRHFTGAWSGARLGVWPLAAPPPACCGGYGRGRGVAGVPGLPLQAQGEPQGVEEALCRTGRREHRLLRLASR